MPGPRNWTEELIEERFKQGRGHGVRETFSPWLWVQEFSSYGNATRVPSLLFRRSIHTFSYIERHMYQFFEYAADYRETDSFAPEDMRAVEGKVTIDKCLYDWREQLPAPREVTLAAAKSKSIRHSRYVGTGIPMVMSIDALAVFHGGHELFVDAKTSAKTGNKRVMDKLRLHKAYAEYVGRPHYIFTEESVSKRKLKNIDLVRSAMPRRRELMQPRDLFSHHLDVVKHDALQKRRISIAEFCHHYDKSNRLLHGTSLRLVWCLIWNKNFRVDMEAERLSDLYVSEIRPGRR